jgi:hypothetical protein
MPKQIQHLPKKFNIGKKRKKNILIHSKKKITHFQFCFEPKKTKIYLIEVFFNQI